MKYISLMKHALISARPPLRRATTHIPPWCRLGPPSLDLPQLLAYLSLCSRTNFYMLFLAHAKTNHNTIKLKKWACHYLLISTMERLDYLAVTSILWQSLNYNDLSHDLPIQAGLYPLQPLIRSQAYSTIPTLGQLTQGILSRCLASQHSWISELTPSSVRDSVSKLRWK